MKKLKLLAIAAVMSVTAPLALASEVAPAPSANTPVASTAQTDLTKNGVKTGTIRLRGVKTGTIRLRGIKTGSIRL